MASALGFALCTVLAAGDRPPAWELTLFQAVNGLPDWLYIVIWPFMQYGVFVTIPIVSIVAVAAGRRRLSVLLLTSGLTIYFGAKLVKEVAGRARPEAFFDAINTREHFAAGSIGYTSGHAAVAGTIATLTWFHLPRRLRVVTAALLLVVAFGRLYVGAHLPLDMLGGILLGISAGIGMTLAFGTTDPATPRVMPASGAGRRRLPSALPVGRHAGDVARVGAGALVLALSVLAVQRDELTVFERNVFLLVHDLPAAIEPVVSAVMQLGNVVAGPALAILALAFGRRRLAVAFMSTGAIAWVAAKVVKDVIQRPRPGGFLDDVVRVEGDGLGFVSGHTAIAFALAMAAAPYLSRRAQRLAWGLAWTVGLARIFVGAHLPMDVVGGAALGWVIGAGFHLLAGAPHRRPSVESARRVLSGCGFVTDDVTPAGGAPVGSFPFVASGPAGHRFVKLLDPERRDHDRFPRIVRFLLRRDVRDEIVMEDTRAQGEHEVAMALLARGAGCRVPEMLGLRHDRAHTWIIEQHVAGQTLDHVEDVDGTLLRAVWDEVATLHQAGVAHRDLVAANVVVDGDRRPWLVDFAHADASCVERHQRNDVAELLASTALLAGPQAAVAAATTVLGEDAVRSAASELQPLALTRPTRASLRAQPGLLESLRATARPVPTDAIPPTAAERWAFRAIGLAGVAALVAWAGFPADYDLPRLTNWRWLGLLVVCAVATAIASGQLVAIAAGHGLAPGRTVPLAVDAATASVTTGRAQSAALAAGLRRLGFGAAEAASSTGRATLGRLGALVLVSGAAIAWMLLARPGWSWPPHVAEMAVVVVVLSSLLALVAGSSGAPRRGSPFAVDRTDLGLLIVAALIELGLSISVFLVAVQATGGDVALVVVVVAGLCATALAWFGEGGPGVAEAASAFILAVGISVPGAVGAVLLARATLYWAPAAAVAGAALAAKRSR